MMSFRNKILARLDSLDMMISPPAAIADILPLMGEESPGSRSELESILKDAGISERVIKVANSPYLGYGGQVNNVDQAMMILGENLVKCLVFSISVYDHVVAKCPGKDKEHNRLWLHFLETASAARNLELILRFGSAEEAYVGGLIHDLGRLFLLAYFGGEAFQVSRLVAGGMTLLDAEREHLGVDHQEIGKMVARRWGLPKSLQEVMSDHHPRHAADLNDLPLLSRIISLSDNLSLSSGEYPQGADGAVARIGIIETCRRFLNLSSEDIRRVYATFPDDVLSSAGALDLDLGDAAEYLSGLNSEMLELTFDLGCFIGERRESHPGLKPDDKTENAVESLRVALVALCHYIGNAVAGISGQFDLLRVLHQKGRKEEIFERVPEIGESLSESARKISGILHEVSHIAGQENSGSSVNSKALDIGRSLKERLESGTIQP